MIDAAQKFIEDERATVYMMLHRLFATGRSFLLRSDVVDGFVEATAGDAGEPLRGSPLADIVHQTQEAAVDPPWIYFAIRPEIGRWRHLRINAETLKIDDISTSQYLRIKEHLVADGRQDFGWPLEIDFGPFGRDLPRLKESRSIGRGLEFLNRRLASQLLVESDLGAERLLRFLTVHTCDGQQLMLNPVIASVDELRAALRSADRLLAEAPPDAPWTEVAQGLHALGFEPGWGRDTARIRETMQLLQDMLEAPSPSTMGQLLARVPMIFDVAIMSPHGYFAQSNVMGLPDTGGQVVYILDQVRALEHEMRQRLADQGVEHDPQILVVTRLIPDAGNTTCDQRIEEISGTRHARILRVPFRSESGEVVEHWISRFEVWPYLERFALEAERDIVAELQTKPDLMIGNYSDGNLVATVVGQRLGVTTCTIAHALEKTKYLLSDLYWQDNEGQYHFSCQFTADLIAMNAADFIITSTYQEIAGTDDSIGQYESYRSFTMPGLHRIVNGIDIYDPRFNIVSPGSDPEIYFPYGETERRLTGLHPQIEEMVFGDEGETARGRFDDPDRPVLFSMARLDRVKNLTGLAEWFGASDELRGRANLLIVGGFVDAALSGDAEEKAEIHRMHEIMDRHTLDGQMRWVQHVDRVMGSELYRWTADRRGAFVQPALFEAFGLTVVEAMVCGLPTFATRFGGPLEIIEHGRSGFHIDPNHGEQAATLMADFFKRCAEENDYWTTISSGGIERVRSRYTWELYADRLMTLARIYGFWRHLTNLEQKETRRYLEMLYALQFRPRAATLDGS